MNDHLSEEDKENLESFKREMYPEYLKDQVQEAMENLDRVRVEIAKDVRDFADGVVLCTCDECRKTHQMDEVYLWLKSKLWNMLEDQAVDKLKKVQNKLKRYAVKQGYIAKNENLFDLEALKEVPLEDFYEFEQKHDSAKGFVALCPLHGEKSPSFHYYKENNSYYCFGCNEGGDVMDFVMKIEGIEFFEACKMINTFL